MAKVWKAAPFTVQRALVVEGGWLQAPWPVDAKVIEGGEFVSLQTTDRNLAKALGMNMSERSPLAKCSFFALLASTRDDAVDTLINSTKVDRDPMADSSSAAQASPVPSKGRSAAFADADIPATVTLHMAAFVTPDGQRVDEHTLRVVTTPKRRGNVTMEATPENFEWLMLAAQVEGDIPKPEKRQHEDEGDDLPTLSPPCQFQKTGGGKLKVYCYYRHQGQWKKHQQSVQVGILGGDSLEAAIRRCEGSVMDFYNSNHATTNYEEGEVEPPPIES